MALLLHKVLHITAKAYRVKCGFQQPTQQVSNSCGPGTTQSIGQNGAIVCIGNQTNTQGNQTQTTGSVTAQGGSVTVSQPPAITILMARAAGNVGVATSTTGQVLGIKELPKTGLPALAWTALALIPIGAKLRSSFKFKGDLENHPLLFWEERQFKKDF